MVKLTPTEKRVLHDIRRISGRNDHGRVKINTARTPSATIQYNMSAHPRTLASLMKKGLIEDLTQFWDRVADQDGSPKTPFVSYCKPTSDLEIKTGYRCSEGEHGGPFKYTEDEDGEIKTLDGQILRGADLAHIEERVMADEKVQEKVMAHAAMDDDGGPVRVEGNDGEIIFVEGDPIEPIDYDASKVYDEIQKVTRDKLIETMAIPAKMLKSRTHDKDIPVHMPELAEGYDHLVIPLERPSRRQRRQGKKR